MATPQFSRFLPFLFCFIVVAQERKEKGQKFTTKKFLSSCLEPKSQVAVGLGPFPTSKQEKNETCSFIEALRPSKKSQINNFRWTKQEPDAHTKDWVTLLYILPPLCYCSGAPKVCTGHTLSS
ncbi:hypothetical protein OUZ56_008888 [Daphnia magna]|uniref:Uncharacterized protein n=1 Tax=Daphnia magna TaxID=35525 RepID=A0ABR0AED2_9CRUS|nr:hypothetical protein OUZ56_008888 [Daphnia magna]